MRKFIYKSVVERLKKIRKENGEYIIEEQLEPEEYESVIKHFDLWHNQLAYIEEGLPFELPAILIEFRPIQWRHQGNAVREAAVEIALHVLTWQNMPTSPVLSCGEESLQFLDLLTGINRALHRYAKADNKFAHDALTAVQSVTDNDFWEIRHDIEVFSCHVQDASAMLEPRTIKKPSIKIQT